MMQLTKNEKALLVSLLERELKQVHGVEESLRHDSDLKWTALEENYEAVLEQLIKKLK